MRRINAFLIILTVSLCSLVTLFAYNLYLSSTIGNHSSWMEGMWRWGGMGSGMAGGSGSAPSYLWMIPIGLIGIVAVSVVGVVFLTLYPEIRVSGPPHGRVVEESTGLVKQDAETVVARPVSETDETSVEGSSLPEERPEKASLSPSVLPQNPVEAVLLRPIETVSKTLTPEERKVLDVLVAHQGKYLQKYIRKEAGLSRLKTHRIVARFVERGIVMVRRSGNTNEVVLSDWLRMSKEQGSA